jgi:multicomponent Na+:H+ antiporter subunit D
MPASATAGGFLLVLAIMLPVAGVLFSLALGGRHAERIALILMPAGFAVAVAIAAGVWGAHNALQYVVGSWLPPLGIALRADGLSAAMILTAALLICGIGVFARAQFPAPRGAEARASSVFWTLLLAVWGALNAVFIGGDLFNLYVALELLTFAAVPLVSLDGRAETIAAALRYLLFALFGSVLYLLGAVLLYGAYGTLDIGLLAVRIRPELAAWVAISLMTAGLLAKAALYPLHLWLPPAHAGAPAPASAILSGLVVKAPFFLVVRLWFDVMPSLPDQAAAQVLGALGAAAILFGSVLALRQARLKLLIAYSTVAQIGYLFLMFPLAVGPETGHPWSTAAWTGGILQATSHAFAKAAMFMAAGLIAEALGHDRIAGLAGLGRALPITVFAFGLGGLSLMGLPPSGGFVAKAMLLTAAVAENQWCGLWSS